MTPKVEIVREYSKDLLQTLNQLIPQLAPDLELLTEEKLTGILESPSSHLYVAKEDHVIVGCLTLVVYTIPTGTRAWIEDVVVSEVWRGKGVGNSLVQAAIQSANSLGAKDINLTSSPSRIAANGLYKKVGFKERCTNIYRYQQDS